MIKQIWKYNLGPGLTTHNMPTGAKVLHADEQQGGVYLWAEVNPAETTEERIFEVFATGQPIYYDIGIDKEYVSTVKLEDLIFHVYEVV